jgi:hypothetical protein
MLTNIEILGIIAVILSNIIAFVSLRRLKEKERRDDQNRMNQHKMLV